MWKYVRVLAYACVCVRVSVWGKVCTCVCVFMYNYGFLSDCVVVGVLTVLYAPLPISLRADATPLKISDVN